MKCLQQQFPQQQFQDLEFLTSQYFKRISGRSTPVGSDIVIEENHGATWLWVLTRGDPSPHPWGNQGHTRRKIPPSRGGLSFLSCFVSLCEEQGGFFGNSSGAPPTNTSLRFSAEHKEQPLTLLLLLHPRRLCWRHHPDPQSGA